MPKKTKLSRYGDFPLYPWIAGAIPIVHFYANNLGLVIDQDAFLCLVLSLLGTTIAFLAINHFLRDRHRTALILTICSIAFSLSGHVYILMFMPKSLGVWTLMILSALICIFFLLQRIRSNLVFRHMTPVFNLVMLCLLALQMITLFVRQEEHAQYVRVSEAYTAKYRVPSAIDKVGDSPARPDIYYIIPDGYPSDAWLAQAMDYDNSEFTSALRERGFVIADHAQSNYGGTYLSLASTLNMQYYESNQSPFSDLDYLRLEIANNLVARQLIQFGYKYIQILSGFWVPSSLADVNRDFTSRGPVNVIVSEQDVTEAVYRGDNNEVFQYAGLELSYKEPFIPNYMDTTMLRLVWSRLDKILKDNFGSLLAGHKGGLISRWNPERFLSAADEAANIASLPEATFTLVHFIKPHLPTTFDENGNFLEQNHAPSHEEFFAEFSFVNSRFLQMIDEILENSQNPPIIIFQSDHGSTYGSVFAPDQRATHFGVYAAYHLPETYSLDLPDAYTLVNTFPMILNTVFGTTYEMRENRLFVLPKNYRRPFQQVDVTDEFAYSDEA